MVFSPAHHDRPVYQRWVYLLCVAFVILTFLVLHRGGQVTSRGAGLAVPDYPRVYGHNMILFPIAMWRGGIYWEHTHRLIAALGGLMAIVVAFALRSTQRQRPWLQWCGVGLLAAYIVQGLLGGFRVTEMSIAAAMVHGIAGQLILCGTVVVAAATGRWWIAGNALPSIPDRVRSTLLWRCAVLLAALSLQLLLGVFVRHGGAALAVPDFPTAYGGLVPPFTAGAIEQAYTHLVPYDADHAGQIPSVVQVLVHWSHRIGALFVAGAVIWMLLGVLRHARHVSAIVRPAVALGILLLPQVAMGAWIVLSHRHVDTATAHHGLGAVLLATAVLLHIRIARRFPQDGHSTESAS